MDRVRDIRSPFKEGSSSGSPNATSQPRPITPPSPRPSADGTPINTFSHDPLAREFIEVGREQHGELRVIRSPKFASTSSFSSSKQVPAAPDPINDTAIASSGSSSPKPAPLPGSHRIQSSFGNRTKRPVSGITLAAKSAEKSGESSARGSTSDKAGGDSSSASGVINEAEKLQDFITLTGEASKLKIGHSSPHGHSVNLSKYKRMHDPNAQLADEMSASSLVQQSTTPDSRRASHVPSLSTSSSPSRAFGQHAPLHGRSRLSGSIREESRASPIGQEEEEEEPFLFQPDE